MFDVKKKLVALKEQRPVSKKVKWIQTAAARIFMLVLYVELCFCAGYILAHRQHHTEWQLQKVVAFAQLQGLDPVRVLED